MTTHRLRRWILTATLAPAAALAAYGCALVGGINPPEPSTCHDKMKNGGETSVDCGGPCGACDSAPCTMDGECASGICHLLLCTPATNADACPKNKKGDGCQACHSCGMYAACVMDSDCASGLCKANQCIPCNTLGDSCPNNGTCSSAKSCVAVTCANGVKDGDETGIDCGGLCTTELGGHACDGTACGAAGCGAACSMPCGDGAPCTGDTDCASKYCNLVEGGVSTCQLSMTCSDGTKNGDETDKDCGGSCSPCADQLHCVIPTDCQSNVCEAHICVSCFDGVMNQNETDVDCGGICAPCMVDHHCVIGADCDSSNCVHTICRSIMCVGNQCQANMLTCGACDGAPCMNDSECFTGHCNNTKAVPTCGP